MPLNKEATEFLLSSPSLGMEKHQCFVNERLRNRNIAVHDPIKRAKIQSFKTCGLKNNDKAEKKC